MKLEAARHEWSSIALAVMIDGMLVVSAQCGCCHLFHSSSSMPFHVYSPFGVFFVCLLSFFSFGLLHVLLYVFWFCHLFVISFLHIILHGLVFSYFLFLILHGACVVGIMGYLLVGVLFFYLCTTTYVCISYDPYNMYPYIFFYFFPSFIFCIPFSWCALPLVLPFSIV